MRRVDDDTLTDQCSTPARAEAHAAGTGAAHPAHSQTETYPEPLVEEKIE